MKRAALVLLLALMFACGTAAAVVIHTGVSGTVSGLFEGVMPQTTTDTGGQ